MKIIKKILKAILWIILLAVLAGSGYIMYDYYQHPEKYEDFGQMFQDKITGRDQIVIEEVSPFKTPTFALKDQDNEISHIGQYTSVFESSEEVFFCYYKSLGGELALPLTHSHEKNQVLLYNGNEGTLTDITEYMVMDEVSTAMIIQEEALTSLSAGEYIIVAGTEGTEDSWERYCLIIEDEVTYNSTQCGIVNVGDRCSYIYNNLDDPKEISFYFYNIGDNRIVTFYELRGGQIQAEIDEKYYTINEQGNKVTLSVEYLEQRMQNTSIEYGVRLANGDEKNMNYLKLWNVDENGLDHLTLSGPTVYSLSEGGDLVITYELGACTNLWGFWLNRWDEEATEIFAAKKIQDLTSPYVDMENQVITVPEEIMQTLEPHTYGYHVGYFIGDYWADSFGPDLVVVE